MADSRWIIPDWPAPAAVRAVTTTRHGGVSQPPYDSFNLGDHVGDQPEAVAENRRRLRELRQLPSEPVWLKQVHGVAVVDAAGSVPPPSRRGPGGGDMNQHDHSSFQSLIDHHPPTPSLEEGGSNVSSCEADASFANRANVVCTVMTADCLPLLFCNRQGTVVAAAHAGWRGLLDGVIEATVLRMNVAASDLLVWLGPAIGPDAFEVGNEVRDAFIAHHAEAASAFVPSPNDRWLADIYQLARQRLSTMGITAIYGGHWCTYSDSERFYSYRRDGVTGRMASLIWLA